MYLYITLFIIIIYFLFSFKRGNKKKKFKIVSEKKLYDLIKKDYPSAIYQYRCEWLERQSYDIFIPNKNIAIEYQGEQHFKPIAYFGGKEKYKQQHKLDKLKKKKSKKHNITLLYFTFDTNSPNRLLWKKVYKDYKKLKWRIRLNWLYKIF